MDIDMFIAAIGLCLRAVQEGGGGAFPYWVKGTGGVEVRLINDRIAVCLRKSALREATTHYHLVLNGKPTIHQLTITPRGSMLDACDLPAHVADRVLCDINEILAAPDIEWHDWNWIEPPSTDPV
jgi:hypothetical protein